MRTIDPTILAQLVAKELRPFQLLTMTLVGGTYYFTDCDVPIVYTNRYQPRGFSHDGAKYGIGRIVDTVKLEIDNIDEQLSLEFIGGDPQGSAVSLKEVVLGSTNAIIGTPITWFSGTIDEWEGEEDRLRINIVGPNYAWSRRTVSRHPSSCRWRIFKGTECAYAGAEAFCDRSYARCLAIANIANFGGFRWLPSIEDKEILWGRKA